MVSCVAIGRVNKERDLPKLVLFIMLIMTEISMLIKIF